MYEKFDKNNIVDCELFAIPTGLLIRAGNKDFVLTHEQMSLINGSQVFDSHDFKVPLMSNEVASICEIGPGETLITNGKKEMYLFDLETAFRICKHITRQHRNLRPLQHYRVDAAEVSHTGIKLFYYDNMHSTSFSNSDIEMIKDSMLSAQAYRGRFIKMKNLYVSLDSNREIIFVESQHHVNGQLIFNQVGIRISDDVIWTTAESLHNLIRSYDMKLKFAITNRTERFKAYKNGCLTCANPHDKPEKDINLW